MPPAARLTDMHTCPMQTPGVPPIPHVGGPIIGPGSPDSINRKNACRSCWRLCSMRGTARCNCEGISYCDDWRKTCRPPGRYYRTWRVNSGGIPDSYDRGVIELSSRQFTRLLAGINSISRHERYFCLFAF